MRGKDGGTPGAPSTILKPGRSVPVWPLPSLPPHNAMTRSLRNLLFPVFLLLAVALQGSEARAPNPADRGYRHLVVLGDTHLPGENLAQKERVIETINRWQDVDMVVVVGDVCADYGTPAEYAAARTFFDKLRKPLLPIAGNHDFIYASPESGHAGFNTGSPASQQAKLQLFRETFGLNQHYYSKDVGNYLLLFLSTDHPNFAAGISAPQLEWLRAQLASRRNRPTIVFFHGPLTGTQHTFKHYVNSPHAIAQPENALHRIIIDNPQLFLWVSGHTHTPATEVSYAAPINLYAGQVWNIHNTDMKHATIWTNSLLLYPDKVVVKTYNHQDNVWLPELERTIPTPQPGIRPITTPARSD